MSPLKRGLSAFRDLGRRYALLFSAGLLSDIGGFSTHTALLLHVYRLTDENAAYMGMMALANLLPMALGAPLGGVWAEKFNRKHVMIACDVARIPLVLMMMTTQNVWLLFALASMTSACTSIFMPSRNSIIPELVRKDQVHLANTLNAGIMSFVHVAGPVAGAVGLREDADDRVDRVVQRGDVHVVGGAAVHAGLSPARWPWGPRRPGCCARFISDFATCARNRTCSRC
jgi:MFS family permease